MKRALNRLGIVAAALFAAVGISYLFAAETTPRLFDRSIMRVVSSSSWADVSAADYTSYQALITIAPNDDHAMLDAQITLDLDFGTDDASGFAGAYTTENVQFAVGRKLQTNWRVDDERETATVIGNNADLRSVTLDLGNIGPAEDARIYVKLSAEQADVKFPYVLTYRAGAAATLTDVSN